MRALVAVPVLLVAASHVAEASCAFVPLVPALMTRRDTHVPADGGILVGYGAGEIEQTGDDPSDVRWTASNGVTLVRTSLAPGLSVYKPTGGTTFTVSRAKGAKIGEFTVDGTSKNTMKAPAAKAITSETSQGFRSTTTVATLVLASAPPPEAVAVITYQLYAKGQLVAAFAVLPDSHDKLTTLEVARVGGHCAQNVSGEMAPSKGTKVAFAYVDAFGRLSPTSAPITVK